MDETTIIFILVISNLLFLFLFLDRLKKEREIRQEAIESSRRVLEGKFKEQLAPILPGFDYNPTDARFLGSPIDFVVFDGLAEKDPKQIVFLEVKTGEAKLTEREKRIKELVEEGKVKYRILRV